MYFHTDDPATIARFARALEVASQEGRKVRVLTDSEGRMKYKIGESIWSEPIDSTPDPYRG